MTEPSEQSEQAGPTESVASAREALLATKVRVPTLRPGTVDRSRLALRLDDGLGQGLILVCAPAGYGKSVLLADWARRSARATAWLSLDAGDNDPSRFWRHVVAALDQVRPGINERVGPLLGPPAPPSVEAVVTAVTNDLVATPLDEGAVLVLDDYHLIDSQPVHSSLGVLLEHLSAGLGVVVASRSDPPLALARLRARGQLTEVRAGELRFTFDEAAALLRNALGFEDRLPDAVVAALAARTEGWAAGLQLAALSLRGQGDVAGFVAAFTGSHRYVLDYLAEEVLERQSEPVRAFLLESSVLERLSGPLCDAVTGRTDSQAMLAEIERAGLFLIPLDDVRGWWRYHHLFADLLRARLDHHAGRTEQLHRAAAKWYEQQGLADDAIHHSLAAADTATAARLIEEHFDTVFNLRGEEVTIRRWMPALPGDVVRSRPRLLLAQAQMASMRGDVETMEPLIDAAEQVATNASPQPFRPTAGIAGSLLVNVPAVIALQRSYLAQLRGDPEGTAAYTALAATKIGADELMLISAVEGFRAMADWLRGRLDNAEEIFAASLASWRSAGQPTTTAWGSYSLARIQRARGHLDAAVDTAQQALAFATVPGERAHPSAGPALVSLAEVAYERNDLDAALGYLTEGIALCRQFVHTPPLASGLVKLAWIRQSRGDPTGARHTIDEATSNGMGPPGLFNPVPAERARLRLAQGDVAAAARWTKTCGLTANDEPNYPNERGHLVLARVLLAQSRPEQALDLLTRLHTAALAQDRTGAVIETSALRALALAAMDDGQAAVNLLGEAAMLGSRQRHIRVFADEGAPIAALLDLLVAARSTPPITAEMPLAYLRDLQRASRAEKAASAGRTTGVVDGLTSRETEVLAMLADGRSNKTIAAELVVTLDTVKKHVSHVLDKLGAANRTEAVARARELHLLS